jgi:hypothetical protein
MKSRQKIMFFLGTILGCLVIFEVASQYNWRAEFPSDTVAQIAEMKTRLDADGGNDVKRLHLSGPFGTLHPVNVLRILFVGDADISRLRVDAFSILESRLDPFISSLRRLGLEIQLESSVINYSDNFASFGQAIRSSDPYIRSHDIHSIFSEWTTSAHVLSYPAHAIPPRHYMVHLFSPHTTTNPLGTPDVLAVDSVGTVSWHAIDCGPAEPLCSVSAKTEDEIASQIITAIRSWLGLSASEQALSTAEVTNLQYTITATHFETILRSFTELDRILSSQPGVAFSETMAVRMREAEECAKSNPAMGALIALELLAHPDLVSAPYFSNEFSFALYAPVAVPVLLPVIRALVKMLKDRRRNKAE